MKCESHKDQRLNVVLSSSVATKWGLYLLRQANLTVHDRQQQHWEEGNPPRSASPKRRFLTDGSFNPRPSQTKSPQLAPGRPVQ